ncbi:type III-A CRISPR-associated RAMP protein Csm3 [Pasteurella skyensis]|uniref:CRISPR system Cms endoribonuclease Csm3 n=1 Tax=Phocoenobacter skyensis TaxID=97481 RepID=A0AAJ6ND65_9PAST|nr:type III-A CRISPR-associated RAMP protein Csm3 [Pasteurella skyensis]MDP8170216.1 type III-A CRISPR-associated RAMP protein Csm3 [Pasteurella skyensis]MDP8174471.1 type III-A CRISPR-associated RAMP protein Csm3 [Pasteurella skyensis]
MKLEKIIEITATLRLETGLHIGAGDSEMHIGGIGNSVIKHPFTQSPYIPGSSLKGKIRSLLEWRSGKVQEAPLSLNDFKDGNEDVKQILQLFGIGADSENDEKKLQEIGVSRLAFWDCSLNKDWEDKIREDNLLLTEAKSENTINRITATADHPRQTERVPAGAKFDFKLTMRKFESDDGKRLLELVLKGLRLLELDSLGGSGSRGYGKVKFEKLMVDNVEKDLTTINPFE